MTDASARVEPPQASVEAATAGDESSTAPSPGPPQVTLGAPAANLLAWVALAAVNAAMIAVHHPRVSMRVRLLHHLYDAGQLLAVGLVAYAAVWAALRWVRLRSVRYALLFALSAGLATLHGAEDWTGLSQRLAATGSWIPWRWALPPIMALFVPLCAWLGGLTNRARFRWIAVGAAMTAAVGHHFVLENGYPGVHAMLVLGAAALMAGALPSTGLPLRGRPSARGRIVARVAFAAAFAAASATLWVRPSEAVWTSLQASPGAIVAPILTRLAPSDRATSGPHYYTGSPWFRDRSALRDVAPGSRPLGTPHSIVVVMTVDAMRPDLIDDEKYATQLPSLHALKRQSALFTHARAPSPSTVTTITSILTGKYYSQLYWTPMPDGPVKGTAMPHEDPSPRLEQLLSKKGVHTIHAMSLRGLAADAGLGIGFSEELKTQRDYGPARELMDLAIDGLRRAGDRPVFLYMHFVDSHAPYNLAGTNGSSFERYLGEVALVDRELGRLVAFLDESGLAERTMLVVSADHGEAFGEHGTQYHATTLYEELLHVPLLVRGEGVAPRTIDTPVSLIDLGPTILDFFGVPTPASFMGESFIPLLRGEEQTFTRPLAADAGRRMQAMLFPDGVKVITDLKKKTLEIYDTRKDPGETDNLVDDMGDNATPYVRALRDFFRVHEYRKPGYETPWRQF